ncbi:MAG: glycoside hydrolase, partial [Planctomycetaceae bacterium]|nr:glycoside hydrolase [Planctomycetaceae bacterium]
MKELLFASFVMFAAATSFADEWKMNDGRLWSRNNNAATLSKEENTYTIIHTGKNDWALSEGNQIAVQFGEIFEITADAAVEGTGRAEISVVTRDKDGKTIAWTYGSKEFEQTDSLQPITAKFAVPRGVATIEPRIVGVGQSTTHIANFTAKRVDVDGTLAVPSKYVKENKFLKIEFSNDVFLVTDKTTGRVWNGTAGLGVFGMGLQDATIANRFFDIVHLETLLRYKVFITLEPDAPEFTIRIEANGAMDGDLPFPPPFESQSGDRLIIPMNEGIGFPVEEQHINVRRLIAYGGHGICMAFWGQIKDATGAGMVAILETPDDASIDIVPDKNKLLQVGAVWEPSMKEFRSPRQLRYLFFKEGGHVAVCKRYRQYAKEIGLLVPFTEKVKRNLNIEKLFGAANIWYWGRNKVELIKEMQAVGIDRILWSGGGSAEELTEMNKVDHVLTSRYDIYQDIMDPARFDDVGYVHGDWTTDAWDHDLNWISPDGTWRKGWEVEQKDKTKPRIPCAVICDAQAVPYAQKRITKELETKPYACRFIDTTVAAPWFECYHPDHPMTRSDSRKHKMELLKLIGDLGLVCGGETGHDASVPFCDYFEGMLSLGPYRIDEAGRDMIRLVEEVPPQIERFQVNPALRLPLWELVYHDCVVAQWYWGDYNNKLPKVWRKRDLFNALYGTPPMYMFTQQNWNENKEKFAE